MFKLGKRYVPAVLETVSYVAPVVVLLATTLTFCTTAPEGSSTLPAIEPWLVWAFAGMEQANNIKSAANAATAIRRTTFAPFRVSRFIAPSAVNSVQQTNSELR